MHDLRSARVSPVPLHPLVAADGAGSATRRQLAAAGCIESREMDLDHGYKELSIPAGPNGAYAMAPDALHIWPRGNYMLIALPNADGSFTATLFLSKHGTVSFDGLDSPRAIEEFMRGEFPDAYALMPDCVEEFQTNPSGFLGTVYANSWSLGGKVALIGDAAHAIVPFHGQGMNCCFEDCLEFDACLDGRDTWQAAFDSFFAARKSNTDAIAAMAHRELLGNARARRRSDF